MIQVSYFQTGGFVVHKAKLAESAANRFSVWFDANGKATEAERFDRLNRSTRATPKQLVSLERRYSYLAKKTG